MNENLYSCRTRESPGHQRSIYNRIKRNTKPRSIKVRQRLTKTDILWFNVSVSIGRSLCRELRYGKRTLNRDSIRAENSLGNLSFRCILMRPVESKNWPMLLTMISKKIPEYFINLLTSRKSVLFWWSRVGRWRQSSPCTVLTCWEVGEQPLTGNASIRKTYLT